MTFIPNVRSVSSASDRNAGHLGSGHLAHVELAAAPLPEIQLEHAQLDQEAPMTWRQDTSEQIALRQLRHHTKNALQRLLYQISACPGLQRDPAGRALAHDLERRILTSASLSDALFGLTGIPSALEVRLLSLGRTVVDLMADGDQEIEVAVDVEGFSPPGYDPSYDPGYDPGYDNVLVRVAYELVGNAIKHGMHLRLVGKIEVTVEAGAGGVTLSVIDDGWGPCMDDRQERPEHGNAKRGEGLRIAALLAEQYGGTLRLSRDRCKTVAMMTLPPRRGMRETGQ